VDAALLDLPPEPTPIQALQEGAAIVTMSGDKLLGGPQAGIVLGRADLVAAMRRDPLCRALRVDKLTLAALEATLRLYLDPERALEQVPTLRMLRATAAQLAARARAFAQRLAAAGVAGTLRPGVGSVGGGAYPDVELPTTLVCLPATDSADRLERRLRAGDPPVLARILDDHVVLDLRTVPPREEDALFAAVVSAHA